MSTLCLCLRVALHCLAFSVHLSDLRLLLLYCWPFSPHFSLSFWIDIWSPFPTPRSTGFFSCCQNSNSSVFCPVRLIFHPASQRPSGLLLLFPLVVCCLVSYWSDSSDLKVYEHRSDSLSENYFLSFTGDPERTVL